MISRQESAFETNLFKMLRKTQDSVHEDVLLLLAKAVGLQRCRLYKIIDQTESATISTLIRLATVIELIGVQTPISKMPKKIQFFCQIYTFSGQELPHFFVLEKDRAAFSYYMRGIRPITSDVDSIVNLACKHYEDETNKKISAFKESYKDIAAIRTKNAVTANLKAPLSIVQEVAQTVTEVSLSSQELPRATKQPHVAEVYANSQATVDSALAILNSLNSLIRLNVASKDVAASTKINAAFAVGRFLTGIGVTQEILEEHERSRVQSDPSAIRVLSSILNKK